MLGPLGAYGGYAGNYVAIRGGMPEQLGAQEGIWRNLCGLTGGYAGTFGGFGRVPWNLCGLGWHRDGWLANRVTPLTGSGSAQISSLWL